MKTLLTVTLFVSTIFFYGQSWCPTNAEWHYSRLDQLGPSYAKVTYVGTITINTVVCQQLNYSGQTYQVGNNTTVTLSQTPYYTKFSNNVVFLLNKTTNQFDTLYNFGAVPNDKWLLPASYSYPSLNTCNRNLLTVTDTGHQNIQGVNLKWLKVQISAGLNLTDTIFERIGFLKNYFLQHDVCTQVQDYVEGGPLRCYNDNQIINYKKVNYACNYLYTLNAVEEYSKSNLYSIFPNPSTNKLSVKFSVNNFQEQFSSLNIKDISGRTILTENLKINSSLINVDISNLQTGIYFLIVYGNNNLSSVTRFVKE